MSSRNFINSRKKRSESQNANLSMQSSFSTKLQEETTFSKIRTVLRQRPSSYSCLQKGETTEKPAIIFNAEDKNLQFFFDYVHHGIATNQAVYEELARDSVQQCLEGMNVCIFAYGMTGSGKTYSIIGTHQDPGIQPRFCQDLLFTVDKDCVAKEVHISAAFYEIYNEKVYDLLSEEKKPLRIRGVEPNLTIENLTWTHVETPKDFEKIRTAGLLKRATASTLINEHSSRSHAIFHLVVKRERTGFVGDVEKKFITQSHVYFVDLAGSERLGMQNFTETVAINTSLSALQRVIFSYAEGRSFVNHRDSVLTRLLKDCFGGNAITTLLALVNPEPNCSSETLSTLRFASQAALVNQRVRRNVDPYEQVFIAMKEKENELRAELERLKKRLSNKHILNWEQLVPPCIIHLMPDASNAFWTKLEVGCASEMALLEGQEPGISITYDGNVVSLDVSQKHEVVLNQKFHTDKHTLLSHGDRIVFGGKHFLWVCMEETPIDQIPTYEKLKLEYIEATAEPLKQKLMEEAKQSVETELHELIQKINQENVKLKEELKEMQTKLGTKRNDKALRSQVKELEANLRDGEELQRALVEDQSQALAELQFTSSDREAALKIQADVKVVTDIFETFGIHRKYQLKLLLSEGQNAQACSIRLTEFKNKMFTDLNSCEFERFRNKLYAFYESLTGTPMEHAHAIENIIASESFDWRLPTDRRTSLVVKRLTMAMTQTASRRNSNVADLHGNFKKRHSVVAEFFTGCPSPAITTDLAVNWRAAMQFSQGLTTQPIPDYQHVLEFLLTQVMNIEERLMSLTVYQQLEVHSSAEQYNKAIIGVLMAATATLSFHQYLVQMKSIVDDKSSFNEHLLEMIDLASSIRKSLDACLTSLSMNVQIAEIYLKNFANQTQRFYLLIGKLSIARNFPLPNESHYEKVKRSFREGMMATVEEISEEAAKSQNQCQKSEARHIRARVLVLVCDVIRTVAEFAKTNYDEHLLYDVLRQSARLKELLMYNKTDGYQLKARNRAVEILAALELCQGVPKDIVQKIRYYLDGAKKLLVPPPSAKPTAQNDLPPRPATAMN